MSFFSYLASLFSFLWLTAGQLIPVQAQPVASVGLALSSFREQIKTNAAGALAQVKALGFRDVEVTDTYGLPATAFRQLLNRNGLKAISLGASFEDLDTNVPKIVADAKALDCKYVVCVWIPHAGDFFTLRDANDAIEVLNTAGKLLAGNGLALVCQIRGYEFQPYQNSPFFEYLAKNFNAKYVNFELNVFWAKQAGQDPIALLQQYGKRFPLMHLRDRRPGTPGNQTGQADRDASVVMGQGDVGIAAILKQAHRSNVKYYFIEDESAKAVEQITASLAFLRSLK